MLYQFLVLLLFGESYLYHSQVMTEKEYEQLVSVLDRLIDEVGQRTCPHVDESHPLASLMEVIGVLIENYEDRYVPELSENC